MQAILAALFGFVLVIVLIYGQHWWNRRRWKRIRRLFDLDPVAGHRRKLAEMGRRTQWGGR